METDTGRSCSLHVTSDDCVDLFGPRRHRASMLLSGRHKNKHGPNMKLWLRSTMSAWSLACASDRLGNRIMQTAEASHRVAAAQAVKSLQKNTLPGWAGKLNVGRGMSPRSSVVLRSCLASLGTVFGTPGIQKVSQQITTATSAAVAEERKCGGCSHLAEGHAGFCSKPEEGRQIGKQFT